jgi:magnesium transporter
VLHAIVDHVVDDYEPVVDGLERDVREVERAVFTRVGGRNPVEQIYVLMRNVLSVQDALTPLLAPLDALARQPFQVIHEDLQEYFRDVHDHLAAVVQRVGTMHDLVTTILAANLTSVSVRQNEDMRKISAWVAIAAVPTVTGAIYGMNFDNMPELHTRYGYFVLLAVMLTLDLTLYRLFRRSGWL